MAAQREWFEKDYYKVLGVAKDAPAKELTKAYRKLARELHPDRNPGNDAAEERFKAVAAAYDVLGDDVKRRDYDEFRRIGPQGGGPGGQSGFSFNTGDMGGGLGDIFSQMFNRGGQRSGRGVGPQRGADVSAQLTLAFAEAVNGITTNLFLTSDAPCSSCAGSGARPGTFPSACSACGGRGAVDDNQGGFSFSSPCRACQGSGAVVKNPCPTCRGRGIERRQREVATRVPAGVSDGQSIRLKGRGDPGRNGGPAGDLLVELTVTPHPRFGRSGSNLTVTVPLLFSEAVLGATIEVPTLEGSTVTLRLGAGTQAGSRHRVKGKGIALTTKAGTTIGDLIVTVEISVPTVLNDEQRAALEQFAAATTVNPRNTL